MGDLTAVSEDGARIVFDVVGSGEPLLLLAGQANSRRWWDPVRPDLAERFRTVAPDAVGTGESDDAGPGGYSIERFARDAVAVLDAAGVDRAHVYGTSMGGRVAQRLAIEHPERVGALVLGCTTPGGPEAPVASPEVLRSLTGRDSRRALAELMVSPAWLDAHPHDVDPVLGDDAMTTAARIGHRRASAAHDASTELGRITAPTLVLHGTDDAFCPPANADLLARGIGDVRVELFPGARHAYFLECAEVATPRVLEFLASRSPAG